MTQRLPVIGSDDGTWGTVLNGFLGVAHNSDGTLTPAAVSSTGAEMTANKGTASGYAPLDGSSLLPYGNIPIGAAGTASKVLAANDASTTNARTPTAHATTHESGGSDAIRLDQLASPTSAVGLGSQKIIGLANGSASTDAAAFGQIPTISQLDLRFQKIAPFAAAAVSNVSSLTGNPTIDGYVLAAGDIVLLTAQTTGSQNGPWLLPTGGGAWTRPSDFATGATVYGRLGVVMNGTTYGTTLWTLTTSTAGVVVDTGTQAWTNPLASAYMEQVIRNNRPEQLTPPAASFNMNSQRIIGMLSALLANDAATLAQTTGSWVPTTDSWVFATTANGTQFSIAGVDRTAVLKKGTKIKWSESSVVKYGVIQSSSFSTDTTVLLIPTSDYVMAANPDASSAYYSYSMPPDFPTKFTWIPRTSVASCTTTSGGASITSTASVAAVQVGMTVYGTNIPTGTVPTVTAVNVATKTITISSGTGVGAGTQTLFFGITGVSALGAMAQTWWSVQNGICSLGYANFTSDTQNSTAFTVTPPIAAAAYGIGVVNVISDNGTGFAGYATMLAGFQISVSKAPSGTAWAGTGARNVGFALSYTI